MTAVGDDFNSETVDYISAFDEPEMAEAASAGYCGHSAVKMSEMSVTVIVRFKSRFVLGFAVTHRRQYSHCGKLSAKLHRALAFGSDRPAFYIFSALFENFFVVFFFRVNDIFFVLCAFLTYGEIRSLKVQTVEIGVFALRCDFAENIEYIEKLFIGAGQSRGEHGRCTVLQMCFGNCFKCLLCAVHEIGTAAAVQMHIDEAGGNIAVAVIGSFIQRVVVSVGADVGNYTVFGTDIAVFYDT